MYEEEGKKADLDRTVETAPARRNFGISLHECLGPPLPTPEAFVLFKLERKFLNARTFATLVNDKLAKLGNSSSG